LSKYTIIISLFIFSCTSPKQPAIKIREDFHIPVIVQKQSPDSIKYRKADCISEAYFRFSGKYKFTDTLRFDDNDRFRDIADIIPEYSFTKKNDSLSTDGFQVFPDYKSSVYYKEKYADNAETFCYFPVYVVNETSKTKVFIAKDRHVFAIQEAVDKTDWEKWYPIEAEGPDFCGNGYFGVKVHPGEFIVFLVPKYQGEEKNRMRIRLQVGEGLYISKPYEGTFSAKQFNIPKESYLYKRLKDPKNDFRYWRFYQAIPKGFD
jgi:hypothetical protein